MEEQNKKKGTRKVVAIVKTRNEKTAAKSGGKKRLTDV